MSKCKRPFTDFGKYSIKINRYLARLDAEIVKKKIEFNKNKKKPKG